MNLFLDHFFFFFVFFPFKIIKKSANNKMQLIWMVMRGSRESEWTENTTQLYKSWETEEVCDCDMVKVRVIETNEGVSLSP